MSLGEPEKIIQRDEKANEEEKESDYGK